MAQFAYSKAGTPVATSTIAAELLARYQDTLTGNIWVATGTSSAAQWVLDFTAETVVPVANGGTGTASPSLVQGTGVTITGSWPNQTINALTTGGTVTSVNVSGGTTGLTTSGGPITGSGTITLAGTLSIENGGTNSTMSLDGASIMVSDGTGIVQGPNGTSTTVLHGSAGGAPSYGPVVLTTDVSGVLPSTNGGAGAVSGILKANGSGTVSGATSGTDYAPPTSGSSLLKGNGSGGFSNAVANTDYLPATSGSAIQKASSGGLTAAVSGTDYAPPTSGSSILYGNGSGGFSNVTIGSNLTFSGGTLSAAGSGSGTVTSVNVAAAGTTGVTFSGGPITGSGTITASANIGYLEIPSNTQSANYTTVLTDSGKSIDHPASDANARTFTIDSNANVAYPVGTCISFSNMSANSVTIAITSDTMYLAGTGSTGSRTLAQYGVATARKILSTTWLISGTNLT